jgi:hypothetical protein
LLVGTDKEGIIQSIIISCVDSILLKNDLSSIFGYKTTSSSSSIGTTYSKLIIWQEDQYCVSVNVVTNNTKIVNKESDAILILYDCQYRHLFRKEDVDIIPPKN